VYSLKGLALASRRKKNAGMSVTEEAAFIMKGLFATITNANFDQNRIDQLIREALKRKTQVLDQFSTGGPLNRIEAWSGHSREDMISKFVDASVQAEKNEDVRSLKEFIVFGLKGLSAYGDHAHILGFHDEELNSELVEILASTTQELSMSRLLELLVRTGNACVKAMALLDRANTSTYGNPEITEVDIGVRDRPGILVSGHDLRDLEELLEQTKDAGIDVYTHGEMLPAHSYPFFKKYTHLAGNYGGSWWKQDREFARFNGPILMTTNCIIPVKDSYRDRIFTTGMTGYPGVPHIPDREPGKQKDFTDLIERAKKCAPPEEIESGKILGGFAHHQIEQLSDKILEALKSGSISGFVVMGGCDGRMKSREYYTEVAKALPADTVILTAGCAKYRYNKLPLGDIGGIPRVLDSGQCNDSYSIAVTAMKLKELFDLTDINELPIDFDVAWYEQKAVCVLLALLALGFKGVRIGPTLPAFVSAHVKETLIEKFGLKASADVQSDVRAIVERVKNIPGGERK
jgi:hydroxylamine reductase